VGAPKVILALNPPGAMFCDVGVVTVGVPKVMLAWNPDGEMSCLFATTVALPKVTVAWNPLGETLGISHRSSRSC
jgi:hypothetical protein